MDRFAKIARKKIVERESISEVVPAPFQEKKILLEKTDKSKTAFTPKMRDKASLREKLQEERKKYAPFLQNLAPDCQALKEKIELTDFVLDGKEKITLPHYGGPTGYAKKTYETKFDIADKREDKSYNVCFTGVDYIATVYVNGRCVGKHEGFFAPFTFDITSAVQAGENQLKIEVENDYSYMGNDEEPEIGHGDKLYAATGLGWDDPELGWHHCPPGMGIYGSVSVEIRERVYISELYARPLLEEGKAEIWVEVYNSDYTADLPDFSVSVYGQNFKETVIENKRFKSFTNDFENGGLLCVAEEDSTDKLLMRKGLNIYRLRVDIPNPKKWALETPYLYQVQVEILTDGRVVDRAKRQFGMRSFYQDTVSEKKGTFYLNGEKIKLRGANTMGFEQWDVLRGDFEQLIDDILYAKICNMNFLRLTQRPVQDEIYEYCDKLGLMTQTDLPLFGVMRRNKFAEGIRQAEEMEKLIRSHPCNTVVSLINEPFPHGQNQPHRHLMRGELENFFKACEFIIKLNNPDRVIKFVDGDYDPPSENMPDNHCYNLWYNGHTIDVGKMIKGYWCAVKPDWYYGCGEFGVEGLDFAEVMREGYPKEWLKEPFDPKNIVRAQSGGFYQFFYPRPESLEEWVEQSQRHQAESLKLMTEAFRRNNDMVTFAVHLFIDAWPSGWMKTIMDCKRNPKPAYFAYKDALEPVMLSLRTDRFTYYADEEMCVETYLCNDTNKEENYQIIFELTNENGKLLQRAETQALALPMQSVYVGSPAFKVETVQDRERFTLTAFLQKDGKTITYNQQSIEAFARQESVEQDENTVWINNLEIGEHEIAGEKVTVSYCPMGALHFSAMEKGNEVNNHFRPFDFKFWYDKEKDYITPIMDRSFSCAGFTPVLLGATAKWGENFVDEIRQFAVAEKRYNGKRYIISTLDLRTENPVAQRFIDYMNSKK